MEAGTVREGGEDLTLGCFQLLSGRNVFGVNFFQADCPSSSAAKLPKQRKMSQQKTKAISRSRETVRAPVHTFDSEDEESGSDNEGSEIMAKDEAEEELDRLVLGDSAGFLDNLRGQMDLDEESSDDERGGADLEGDAGLEGVDDADVGTLPQLK